jgi:hypothetical protein
MLTTQSPITRSAVLHDATALARRAQALSPMFLEVLTDKAPVARIAAVGANDPAWIEPGLKRESERWHEPELTDEPQTGLVVGATTRNDRLAFLLGSIVNDICANVFGASADGGFALDAAVFDRVLSPGSQEAFNHSVERAGYATTSESLAWIWRDYLHRALAECHTMSPDMVGSAVWLDRMYDQYAKWHVDSTALAAAIEAEDKPLSFVSLPLFLETDASFRTLKALRRGAHLPQQEAADAIEELATCAYGLAVRRSITALAGADVIFSQSIRAQACAE